MNDPETQEPDPIGDSYSDATYPNLITDDTTQPTDHEDIINPIVNDDGNDHKIPPDMDLYDPLSAEGYQHHTLDDTPSKDTIDSLDAMNQQHQLIGGGKERIGGEIGDQQQLGGEIRDEQQLKNMKTQKKVREPYLLRSRKPKESVFQTLLTEERCYNLAVSDALQLHGDSAVAALVEQCTT